MARSHSVVSASFVFGVVGRGAWCDFLPAACTVTRSTLTLVVVFVFRTTTSGLCALSSDSDGRDTQSSCAKKSACRDSPARTAAASSLAFAAAR